MKHGCLSIILSNNIDFYYDSLIMTIVLSRRVSMPITQPI